MALRKISILLVNGEQVDIEAERWEVDEDGEAMISRDAKTIFIASRGQWVYISDRSKYEDV